MTLSNIWADTDSAELALEITKELRYYCQQLNVDTYLIGGLEGEIRAIKDFKVKLTETAHTKGIDGYIGKDTVQIKNIDSWTDVGGGSRTIEFHSPSFDWLILYTPESAYKIPCSHLLDYRLTKSGKPFMKPRGKKYRITCTQEFIMSIIPFMERKYNG